MGNDSLDIGGAKVKKDEPGTWGNLAVLAAIAIGVLAVVASTVGVAAWRLGKLVRTAAAEQGSSAAGGFPVGGGGLD